MNHISQFSAQYKEYAEKMDVALLSLQEDFKTLYARIKELQESPDTVTPADQKLLDDIISNSKLVAERLSALDDLTPPRSS